MICEVCWNMAGVRCLGDTSKTQYEHYLNILKEQAERHGHVERVEECPGADDRSEGNPDFAAPPPGFVLYDEKQMGEE